MVYAMVEQRQVAWASLDVGASDTLRCRMMVLSRTTTV